MFFTENQTQNYVSFFCFSKKSDVEEKEPEEEEKKKLQEP